MPDLDGKVAIVTGAGQGLGRGEAIELATHGARVVVNDFSDAAAGVVEEIKAAGGDAVAHRGDVADWETARAIVGLAVETWGKLDILVNNAGAAWGVEFDQFPESGWDKVMNLNVKSPFFLTQKLHAALKAAASAERPAKVINIGSIDGMRLNPWETYSYHASKSAILYLTKRMAARLVREHIYVTAIAPGAFASEMNKAARDHGAEVARSIPAKRIGRPEDMAAAAIYLASRAGDYVIGETLTVDGGLVHAALGSSIDATDP